MGKTVVVIPTYNERENISSLIDRLLSLDSATDVVVVDDNSPDGTAEIVEQMAAKTGRVSLIRRQAKLGLGSAYIEGFKHALKMGAECVIQMDADFSHDPSYVPELLESLEECDVVIGSRYISGANVVNWPVERLLLSYLANVYTRLITGLPVYDATSGFKCIRRRVLEAINLDSIISDGYCFQIEVNLRAWRRGFKLRELPIIFIERRSGESKMSRRIVWEAAWRVWWFRLKILLGQM